jgi:hypothetical protein
MTDSPDPLAFTPVPSASRRRDGWTADKQCLFIQALSEIGVVTEAARVVGMSRKSAYALRGRRGAGSFAAAWDRALDCGYERALGAVLHRIHRPLRVPVVYRGKVVGEKLHYDNKLLIAALNLRARLREADAPAAEWDF